MAPKGDRNRSDRWFGHESHSRIDRIEETIVHWLARHSVPLLHGGLGVIFPWFGARKYVPGASPAQELVIRTADILTIRRFQNVDSRLISDCL